MYSTFADLLDARLRDQPGQPFLTWYDDSTGERMELSVTTYANWVAKVANLFLDEYLLDPGDTVHLDLPAHWLVPVFQGAAWQVGLTVTGSADQPAALRITGPDGLADKAKSASGTPLLACSLLPFAVRFRDPLPDGVDDFGLLWPGQPDALLGAAERDGEAVALAGPEGQQTQTALIRSADRAPWPGTRLLTDRDPGAHPAELLLAALVRGGSLVLMQEGSGASSPSAPDPWSHRAVTERVTALWRDGDDPTQPRAE